MKREDWKKILYQSLSGFVSLALAIVLFFVIQRFSELRQIFYWIKNILTPFVYGGVMAYLLKTPCNFLEKRIARMLPEKQKKYANVFTVVIVMFLTFFVIYLLFSLVLPEMVKSIISLVNIVPKQVDQFTKWLSDILEGNEVALSYINTGIKSIQEKLQSWSQTDLLPTLQGMMGGFASTVGTVVSTISNLFIGIIICIYLLLSRKTLARQGTALVYAAFKPRFADKLMKELTFIDKTFVGFFGGKILDSAIVGIICYVFCLIMSFTMGFPNAVLISVIIGVTNIIPYFGPFIGAIPCALLVLISSPINCMIFVIFIIILQQFDGNILGPRLLANSVGLTGFWVLFSITLFQGLFGFVGILIGVPVFAVIYDVIKRLVIKGLQRHGKMEVLTGEVPKVQETSKK